MHTVPKKRYIRIYKGMTFDIGFSIWHVISDSANDDDFLPLRCASVIIVAYRKVDYV